MTLTRRQSEVLDFLRSYIVDNRYAPSFEEIAEHFQFQSLATVHEHLSNLERKGYIKRSPNESRAIEIAPPRGTAKATEIPLLGSVAAGVPIESLFIDEGFGSLDEEALDEAMRALAQVRGAGRLVGVVSHVPELKRQIGSHLEVTATPRGSTARLLGWVGRTAR